MEIFEGITLRKYLMKSYSNKPKNWSFTLSPSRDGFIDAVFSNQEEIWRLKLDSIYKPTPLVLGSKVEESNTASDTSVGALSYGYRRLDSNMINTLLQRVTGDKDGSIILDSLLRPLETVVPKPSESYAQGPFVFTNRKITGLSRDQVNLDERLSAELKRLLRNKYPGYL